MYKNYVKELYGFLFVFSQFIHKSVNELLIQKCKRTSDTRHVRLKREMQRLWDDGTLDQTTLDKLAGEHLRTPYSSL